MEVQPIDPEALRLWSTQALDAEEGEARQGAIRALALTTSPVAIDTLRRVARNATDLRERLQALSVLQQIASRGDPDRRIEGVFRDMASDPDEHVAALAREAWEQLSRAQ